MQQSSAGSAETSKRPDLLGLADDLGLVPGRRSGRSTGRSAALLDDAEVVQRLRGDLAERVAGDERLAALAPRERGGDLQHQAPLRSSCSRPAPAAAIRRWASPKGTTKQPRAALEAVELRDVRVGLVDRLGPRVRAAAEVDEVAAQAALHRPVGGDGRVDPAREQDERAAGDADGEAAAAGELLGEREDLALVDLEEDLARPGSSGRRRARARPGRGGRRASRAPASRATKPLSRRRARIANVSAGRSRSSSTAAAHAASGVFSTTTAGWRRLTPRMSQCAREQLVRRTPARARRARRRAGAARSGPRSRRSRVTFLAQLPVEERAVAPLEHDLAELEQHAGGHVLTVSER